MSQTTVLNRVLDRAVGLEILSREDAYTLVSAPLDELCRAAGAVRDRRERRVITYSRSIFIPLTNICRDYCGYCTFRKDPDELGAHTMTPDEVRAVVAEGRRRGCREVLFSLGDKSEVFPAVRRWLNDRGYRTMLEYLAEMCRLVVEEFGMFPHTNAGVIGPKGFRNLQPWNLSMGLMLEQMTDRLIGPGGAHVRAPDKHPLARLRTLERAGKLRIPFTTGLLIGIGETWEERVDTLLAIRAVHEGNGHIQEVIVQNFKAKPGTPMALDPEPAGEEILRTIALSRLVLGPAMNIQAPPNLIPGALDRVIAAGINDWGGVSPLTIDFINPEMPWPQIEELGQVTEATGFSLRERLPTYPEYLTAEFIPEKLRGLVSTAVDADGYVHSTTTEEG